MHDRCDVQYFKKMVVCVVYPQIGSLALTSDRRQFDVKDCEAQIVALSWTSISKRRILA